MVFFNTAVNDLKQALSLVPAETLSDIWKNHLVLSPVGGGADLPLSPSDFKVGSLASLESVVSISLSVLGRRRLRAL